MNIMNGFKYIITLIICTISFLGVSQEEQDSSITEPFIPDSFVVFDEIIGDLNKDGFEDIVVIVKGTDKKKIYQDENNSELDRNRRGILILFKKEIGFELVLENLDCFSSENEYGGGYYAPQLAIEISQSNLYVSYNHGKYGYWSYVFDYRNSSFEMIRFDSASRSYADIDFVAFDESSLNFLTKKKLNVTITGVDEFENETYIVEEEEITVEELMKLSDIEDFDELNFE